MIPQLTVTETAPHLTQREIAARVQPHLQNNPISGVVLEIAEDLIHREDNWFYVPVRLNTKEPRTFEYYDMLVEIEDEIAQQERLRIMLVPAGQPITE